jgi:hypothetical protein
MTLTQAAPSTTPRTAKPKPAISRDRWHRYTYAGVTYPGVTGILKVIDKSEVLMRWASRQTAEAALALGPELAKMQETIGPNGVIDALTKRSAWKNDEARDMGSAIHEYADRYAKGLDLGEVSDSVRRRVEHYCEWLASSGWKVRLSEAYVLNKTLGYGGTLDLLAYDEDGQTVLADVKSGKGVYSETRLQLLAYGEAELIAPPDSLIAYPMPPVHRYVVLHVTEAECRPIDIAVTDLDREAFRACLPLSRWKAATKDERL